MKNEFNNYMDNEFGTSKGDEFKTTIGNEYSFNKDVETSGNSKEDNDKKTKKRSLTKKLRYAIGAIGLVAVIGAAAVSTITSTTSQQDDGGYYAIYTRRTYDIFNSDYINTGETLLPYVLYFNGGEVAEWSIHYMENEENDYSIEIYSQGETFLVTDEADRETLLRLRNDIDELYQYVDERSEEIDNIFASDDPWELYYSFEQENSINKITLTDRDSNEVAINTDNGYWSLDFRSNTDLNASKHSYTYYDDNYKGYICDMYLHIPLDASYTDLITESYNLDSIIPKYIQ